MSTTITAAELRERLITEAEQLSGKERAQEAPKEEVKKEDLLGFFTNTIDTTNKIEFASITGYTHSSGKEFWFTNDYECPEELKQYIPKEDKGFVFDETYTLALLMSIAHNKPVMAFGPPGTGKSETPQQLCARLGRPFMLVTGMGGTEPADYIGAPTVEDGEMKWVDGDVTLAVRKGMVLLYDEPFKSSAQTNMCLQSLLDGRRVLKLYGSSNVEDRTLQAHEDFRIIMADNVRGVGDDMHRYSAEVQDQSTLNRLTYKVQVNYPSPEVEASILKNTVEGATDLLIDKVVQMAGLLRQAWNNDDIAMPYTLRDTKDFLFNAVQLQDVKEAFSITYYQAVNDDSERNTIRKAWDVVGFDSNL